ncbi:MAG: cytochrome b/b6 domain-containing protein [Pseudomonadales bacterium]|nr:cytochrome b/b6 domain-containing protein [Pseudomonadales bacterium]
MQNHHLANQPLNVKSTDTYDIWSKLFHWISGTLILLLLSLGFYMTGLDYYDKNYNLAYTSHKYLGLLALLFGLAQLCWLFIRKTRTAERFVPGLPKWQLVAAQIMHIGLLIMILLIPVSGYMIITSNSQEFFIFDLFPLPAVLPENLVSDSMVVCLHFSLAYTTACLALLHLFAALKHHFIDKDDTLRRILF